MSTFFILKLRIHRHRSWCRSVVSEVNRTEFVTCLTPCDSQTASVYCFLGKHTTQFENDWRSHQQNVAKKPTSLSHSLHAYVENFISLFPSTLRESLLLAMDVNEIGVTGSFLGRPLVFGDLIAWSAKAHSISPEWHRMLVIKLSFCNTIPLNSEVANAGLWWA